MNQSIQHGGSSRSLASAAAPPAICPTPECLGVPAKGEFWCPYCLALAAHYTVHEPDQPAPTAAVVASVAASVDAIEQAFGRGAQPFAAGGYARRWDDAPAHTGPARSVFDGQPGRIDTGRRPEPAASDLEMLGAAGPTALTRSLCGAGIVGLIAVAFLPWPCSGLTVVGMLAGWMFRASAAAEVAR